MKTRKLLLMFLVLALAVGSVFANGKKETVIDETKPVKIVFLLDQTSSEMKPDGEVKKIIDERFDVDIQSWSLDTKKFYDQLNVRFAGGEMPDVFIADSGKLPDYVDGGILHELPIEVIRAKAPNYAACVDATDPDIWNAMMYNGVNYGISNPMSVYPMAVYWRKDWLDNLNLAVPTTIAEMERVLLAFVNDDPDGNGKNDTAGMGERAFNAVFGAYGLRVATGNKPGFKVEEMQLNEEGLPYFPYIDSDAKEVLELLNRWYNLGILDKEFVTGENHGGYAWLSHSFMNGRIGCTVAQVSHYLFGPDTSNPENWGTCMKEFKGLCPDGDIVIGPAPIGPYGESGTEGWARAGKQCVFTQKAFDDPRKIDRILAMLDAYYSDMDYAVLATYGIKDNHYKETDNGLLRLKDGVEIRQEGILQVSFGNTIPFANFTRKGAEDFSRSVTDKGYFRLSIPSTTEFTNAIATLDTLTEQAYFDIITGSKPLAYFDVYVERFLKSGGASALEAVQTAYKKTLGK